MGAQGNGNQVLSGEHSIERLLASDFDETMAVTSEPAPNGMTVALAYEHAVQKVLGYNALEIYRTQGGLLNRSPVEVTAQLLPVTADDITVQQRSEDLVEAKLEVLSSQVGELLPDGGRWPRPVAGFVNTWNAVSEQPNITTGVTSSGHQPLIERFCDVQEVARPDIMVTDDDMRPLLTHLPTELCVKPGRLIIDLLQHRWLKHLELPVSHETLTFSRNYIVGVGDDGHYKDSRLADNAGIEFVKIDPEDPVPGWQAVGKLLVPHLYEEVASA
ncbi:MAG: hypothetical protein JWL89_673 [Candidatus Saccharibacteria bacterium]|nr:hypothetical protein [Candidatus Saccharibacteria bacterium]